MFTEVVFDVETKKLFNEIEGDDPAKLGLSILSLYHRRLDDNLKEVEGKLASFWERELDKAWPLFQTADRVIGFNSIKFDAAVCQPYANFPFNKLPHFDLMVKVKEVFGRRIPLQALVKETLDQDKSDVGVNAVYYWQQGDEKSLNKLKKYCEDDVLLTRDLYDFGLQNSRLRFKDKWNTIREIEVDFSYPQGDAALAKQSVLF